MSDESYGTRIDTRLRQSAGKTIDNLIMDLKGCPPLSGRQQENVARLILLSKKFHDRIGIPSPDMKRVIPETIILESGHQPNFLPHSGVWKKAYLLSRIQEQIIKNGGSSVAFFGYADQNLSTAKLLYRSHIPALNKDGKETIGFSIAENDHNKSFCSLPKPSIEAWLNELDRIKMHYLADAAKLKDRSGKISLQLGKILDILQKSYKTATNFAELNAIIFSRICNDIFGIQLRFFLYSELQKDYLFADESRHLLQHYRKYNQTYNHVVTEKKLDIHPVHLNHLPLWYHCSCGTKIDLFIDKTNIARGECPACHRKYALEFGHDFIRLPEYYARMDFNAVSRSVVLAEGLGDALFLSGAGGSLRYGLIADQIAKNLGYRQTPILFWRSTDYYLGLTHAVILAELGKTVGSDPHKIPQAAFCEKITGMIQELTIRITTAESLGNGDKTVKVLKNDLHRLVNLVSTAEKNFTLVPSVIDLLVSLDSAIPRQWEYTLKNASITSFDQVNKIDVDVLYPSRLVPDLSSDDIRQLYTSLRKTGAVP
jgi:hypothetical protein